MFASTQTINKLRKGFKMNKKPATLANATISFFIWFGAMLAFMFITQ